VMRVPFPGAESTCSRRIAGRALLHGLQADVPPPAALQVGRVESPAVVLDRHLDVSLVKLRRTQACGGLGVLAHVGQGFLNDPDDLDLGFGAQRMAYSLGTSSATGRPV